MKTPLTAAQRDEHLRTAGASLRATMEALQAAGEMALRDRVFVIANDVLHARRVVTTSPDTAIDAREVQA